MRRYPHEDTPAHIGCQTKEAVSVRDYGKISTSLWRSRKFRSLRGDNDARLLYFYLHTCPQVSSIGCFPIPLGYIQADLGWSEKETAKAIDTLSKGRLIVWNEIEELIRIVNFIDHDRPTNPKHAGAAAKLAFCLPDCLEKLHVFMDLMSQSHKSNADALQGEIDRLSIGYRKPIETQNQNQNQNQIEEDIVLTHSSFPKEENDTFDLVPAESNSTEVTQRSSGDVAIAVARYNAVAERAGLPLAQKITTSRKSKLRARLKDCGGLDGWDTALAKLEASNFLCGENDQGFRADLDFILQAKSFTKLMEGSYDNRKSNRPENDRNKPFTAEEVEMMREKGVFS